MLLILVFMLVLLALLLDRILCLPCHDNISNDLETDSDKTTYKAHAITFPQTEWPRSWSRTFALRQRLVVSSSRPVEIPLGIPLDVLLPPFSLFER